jgi:hypothetical protein
MVIGLLNSEQLKVRLDICKSCNKMQRTKNWSGEWGMECTLCGCRIKLKARVNSSLCPIGKWQLNEI